MHKKSIEASQKLKEEEERESCDDSIVNRLIGEVDMYQRPLSHGSDEDRRKESIKLLRAKAQSYSARMLHGLQDTDSLVTSLSDFSSSGFQSPCVTMVTTGC